MTVENVPRSDWGCGKACSEAECTIFYVDETDPDGWCHISHKDLVFPSDNHPSGSQPVWTNLGLRTGRE